MAMAPAGKSAAALRSCLRNAAFLVVVLGACVPPRIQRGPSPVLADSLYREAVAAMETRTRSEVDRAAELLERALELYDRTGSATQRARAAARLGTAYVLTGWQDTAEALLRPALPVLRDLEPAGASEAAYYVGVLDLRRSHQGPAWLDSADHRAQEALRLATAAGSTALQSRAMHLKAAVRMTRPSPQPDSALFYLREALALARAADDRRGECSRVWLFALLHRRQGRSDSARIHARSAVDLASRAGYAGCEAGAREELARLELEAGRRDVALRQLRDAADAAGRAPDRSYEGWILESIGSLFAGHARLDSAFVYYELARRSYESVDDRHSLGHLLLALSGEYLEIGRVEAARAHAEQARQIFDELRDPDGKLGAASQLVAVESASISERLDRPLVDSVAAILGEGYALLGAADTMREDLAAAAMRRRAERAPQPLTDQDLEYAELDRPMLREMVVHYEEPALLTTVGQQLQLHRLAVLKARRDGDPETEANSLLAIANTYLQYGFGDTPAARALYDSALAIQRRHGFRAGEALVLRDLARIHYTSGDPRAAVAYYDSAASARAQTEARAGPDVNRLALAAQDVDLYGEWALAWLARTPEVGRDRAALAALGAAERGRAQALLDLLRDSAVAPEPGAELATEAAALAYDLTSDGASVLYYHLAVDTLLVWLITPPGEVHLARQGLVDTRAHAEAPLAGVRTPELMRRLRRKLGRDTIAEYVLALRGALGTSGFMPRMAEDPRRGFGLEAPVGTDPLASAARLARLLLPDEFSAQLADADELVIIPQGALGLVPFALLPFGRQPLARQVPLRYAPSLATLAAVSTHTDGSPPSGRALVVGNPAMPAIRTDAGTLERLPPLPGAEREARWVARRLNANALIGPAATEAAVVTGLRRADVVHLATHGLAFSSRARARDSFIALAAQDAADPRDGPLTVGDILDSAPPLRADLVVLSACQTGLGNMDEAEGTVGLQRAFLAKGARSLLVSLWNVDDLAAEALMRAFYSHWLGPDSPTKAEALRRAQLQVRERFPAPRDWAAFLLVGAN